MNKRSTLTRRQMLKTSAGAAIAGYIAARATDAHAEQAYSTVDGQDVVVGVVERVESPRTLSVRRKEGRLIVRFSDDAFFSRGDLGIVADCSAFVRRDEIIAEGHQVDGAFSATVLMTMYRAIEGRILDRQDNRLQTTSGIVQLTSDTELLDGDEFMNKPLTQLTVGDDIWTDGWRDPSVGQFVALRVGVKKAEG